MINSNAAGSGDLPVLEEFDACFVVEVRHGCDRSWSHGFEIVEHGNGARPAPAFRLRRLSDGRILPALFSVADVVADPGPLRSNGAPPERREMFEREARLLAERDRIGRELHKRVIQRLFAVGMRLQSALTQISDVRARAAVDASVDDIDGAVAAIRSAIFDMGAGSRPN